MTVRMNGFRYALVKYNGKYYNNLKFNGGQYPLTSFPPEWEYLQTVSIRPDNYEEVITTGTEPYQYKWRWLVSDQYSAGGRPTRVIANEEHGAMYITGTKIVDETWRVSCDINIDLNREYEMQSDAGLPDWSYQGEPVFTFWNNWDIYNGVRSDQVSQDPELLGINDDPEWALGENVWLYYEEEQSTGKLYLVLDIDSVIQETTIAPRYEELNIISTDFSIDVYTLNTPGTGGWTESFDRDDAEFTTELDGAGRVDTLVWKWTIVEGEEPGYQTLVGGDTKFYIETTIDGIDHDGGETGNIIWMLPEKDIVYSTTLGSRQDLIKYYVDPELAGQNLNADDILQANETYQDNIELYAETDEEGTTTITLRLSTDDWRGYDVDGHPNELLDNTKIVIKEVI